MFDRAVFLLVVLRFLCLNWPLLKAREWTKACLMAQDPGTNTFHFWYEGQYAPRMAVHCGLHPAKGR